MHIHHLPLTHTHTNFGNGGSSLQGIVRIIKYLTLPHLALARTCSPSFLASLHHTQTVCARSHSRCFTILSGAAIREYLFVKFHWPQLDNTVIKVKKI